MERRSVPTFQPSWMYLTNRQLAAGAYISATTQSSFIPVAPKHPRKSIRKDRLVPPRASTPWASTLSDSSLATLLGDDELGRTALARRQARLQPRSYDTYASALSGFLQFCLEPNIAPLASTPIHIARDVLGKQGTVVAATSLRPYMSAILKDHGVAPVVLGPLVSDVRAGLRNSQAAVQPTTPRIPLPAPVALAILVHTEQLPPTIRWITPPGHSLLYFRAMMAVLITYTYFCRGDCGVSMRSTSIAVHDNYITLFLCKAKGRAAHAPHQLPLLQIPVATLLLTHFIGCRQQLASLCRRPVPDTLYLALYPGESTTSWNAATLSEWLCLSCALVNHDPPPGFKWTSHSLRKGVASAANSINVGLTKIRYLGGWAKDPVVVHDYIDPTMAPTPTTSVFFGHLLPPSSDL